MALLDLDTFQLILNLEVNFQETWNAIHEDQQTTLVKKLLEYIKSVCNYSDLHQRIYATILSIFQQLGLGIHPAWLLLHQFFRDNHLSVSGRNNATWIVLGLLGNLIGRPIFDELINECIFMLLKNMTTEVLLNHVSLNISYYEHLDVDSDVKQPGIGLYAVVGSNMLLLWPICCRQLQRLMDEEGGLLKTIKILIGLFDYRHSEYLAKENTQECDDLVANIYQRAQDNIELNIDPYVNWIRQAHMRDNSDETDATF